MQRPSVHLWVMVTYKNKTTGVYSEKMSKHIYFMEDDLLHVISKLHVQYVQFHVAPKVLRIF